MRNIQRQNVKVTLRRSETCSLADDNDNDNDNDNRYLYSAPYKIGQRVQQSRQDRVINLQLYCRRTHIQTDTQTDRPVYIQTCILAADCSHMFISKV